MVRCGQLPGHFFINIGYVSAYLYVPLESHVYIDYHQERKEWLQRAFVMERIKIALSSVTVGHGFVKHGGSECRESHCHWYQMYRIPENHNLPDAIEISYGESIHVGSRANALSVRKVGDSREVNVDVGNSKKQSSEDNDEMNSELSTSSLETRSIPENA